VRQRSIAHITSIARGSHAALASRQQDVIAENVATSKLVEPWPAALRRRRLLLSASYAGARRAQSPRAFDLAIIPVATRVYAVVSTSRVRATPE